MDVLIQIIVRESVFLLAKRSNYLKVLAKVQEHFIEGLYFTFLLTN